MNSPNCYENLFKNNWKSDAKYTKSASNLKGQWCTKCFLTKAPSHLRYKPVKPQGKCNFLVKESASKVHHFTLAEYWTLHQNCISFVQDWMFKTLWAEESRFVLFKDLRGGKSRFVFENLWAGGPRLGFKGCGLGSSVRRLLESNRSSSAHKFWKEKLDSSAHKLLKSNWDPSACRFLKPRLGSSVHKLSLYKKKDWPLQAIDFWYQTWALQPTRFKEKTGLFGQSFLISNWGSSAHKFLISNLSSSAHTCQKNSVLQSRDVWIQTWALQPIHVWYQTGFFTP